MKITVAMRVIGGFVVISLLLIALGASSIWSMNRIGGASQELSTLALPTVAGSSDLKASFLNMGRLTFEGFVNDEKDVITEKQSQYQEARVNFGETMDKLRGVVSKDPQLVSSVDQVNSIYAEFSASTNDMFASHISSVDFRNELSEKLSQLEENIDDASSLLLDFTDLDEIADSANLSAASEMTGELESGLLSLLSSASEYLKTESLARANLRKDDVGVLLSKSNERLADIIAAANGEDDSGYLDDVSELMGEVNSALTGSDGIISTKLNELKAVEAAESHLQFSDEKIVEASEMLIQLNSLADNKAKTIKDTVSGAMSQSTWLVIVAVIVSVAFASGIAYVSVMAIVKPLAEVNKLLKIASSGDLTHRLDDSSNDEFGILSRNCNQLIDNLKDLINTINQRADQLAAASNQTSRITSQTTISIEDQKSQISQIAAATTEMHTTSELVSANADDTLKEIKHADVEAEKVKAISAKNKSTIQVLANDVEQAAEVINKLHQDSASIGGILDVIRGVADQTNLLALNAAIEAARAGEQGRGFAVVADEVRTLASRTQQSTQEINSMIEVLQAGAEKAVAVMNQGKEQTVVCVEQTETAGEALNLITDAVHKAYEVSTRIEQAAREQHTVSSEISERLENIVGIAEQTTVGAQQTSDSSAEVARLAEELQESIGSFKV
jgi:methyl-accepting chemotaxis protein